MRQLETARVIFENATRKEGGIHERVRLFEAVKPSWRKRALHKRVTDESLEHEATCRGATQGALTLLQREHRALLDDYRAALHELQRIGNGDEVDPTEIANQAIDMAEARMARFDTESVESKLRVQSTQLEINLSMDTSALREQMAAMRESLRSMNTSERRERAEDETYVNHLPSLADPCGCCGATRAAHSRDNPEASCAAFVQQTDA